MHWHFQRHQHACGACPQVRQTLDILVSTELADNAWRLSKGSRAAVHYRAQLLGVMDALVAAAEAGVDVTGALKVMITRVCAQGIRECTTCMT